MRGIADPDDDCLQLALLAKAVLIALLGEDALWPDGRGKVGLIYLFAAICASLLLLAAEMLSANALISGLDCASSPFSAWQRPRVPR